MHFFLHISNFFCNFAPKSKECMPMKEPKRILFISQEITPYLAEETPIRLLNRQLPEDFAN